MAYTLSVASFYVAIYAFIAGSPFVYISYFHVDAKYYGLLFGMNMIGVSSIGLFNRKMVTLYSLDKLLLFSTSTAIIGGIGLFCLPPRVGVAYLASSASYSSSSA